MREGSVIVLKCSSIKSAILAEDISLISSSLNSSVPHFVLFSSAFSALLKSFSEVFLSWDFTISVEKIIIDIINKETLNKLKEANYKLAILSNGTPDLLNQLVKSNDLENMFDDIFSIEEVGIYKPDSKVYDIPIKKYRVQKSQILFLSANTWDVSGAGNYGYNSVWVNRNNNIFDNLDYKPSHKIKSLDQLLEIMWFKLM